MEYGIQRRSIVLIPPDDDGLAWIFSEFDREEIWQMFGLTGPARMRILRAHRSGDLVVGEIRHAKDHRRIGFVVVFPPTADFDFWEFSYAIPDPKDRDAYSAMSASDAMAHYMFEHLRIEPLCWRTRADNRASDAVIRRIGYESFGAWEVDGHPYTFYRLDRDGWAKRRRKLDLGEARHPSGIGGTFATLDAPPYRARGRGSSFERSS